jgi:arylsulfatase A-like enzyme
VVRNTPSQRNPGGGFGRGFDLFLEGCNWKPARCVNRLALEQLAESRKGERPLFLYLHYIDPHDPYAPPRDHPLRFARGTPGKDFIRQGNPNPIGEMLYQGAPDPGATAADVQHLLDLYDDEIAYFDARFAELLQSLEDGGWLDSSLLVFAADHGEEFLEHGHIKHCRTVFDTVVRTPLFFHIPGVPAKTIAEPVQNLDIVPTLLDYLGVPAGEAKLEGESLRPLIETGQAGDPYQYSLGGSYRSVADGRYKLIQHLAKRDLWLFDLWQDPGEKTDVLAAERRSFHRLRGRLESWLARTEGRADEGLRKSQEAEARLRALGYLE